MTSLLNTPKPGNYPPPAKRYPLFITAFEREVTEAQKAIDALRRLEHLYNIVRGALIAVDLPHDIRLTMSDSAVRLHITLDKTQAASDLRPLVERIGAELVQAGLRTDPKPAEYIGSYLSWSWRLPQAAGDVLDVIFSAWPDYDEGCADYAMQKTPYTHTGYNYQLVPRAQQPRATRGTSGAPVRELHERGDHVTINRKVVLNRPPAKGYLR
jgi:hypothetical protein